MENNFLAISVVEVPSEIHEPWEAPYLQNLGLCLGFYVIFSNFEEIQANEWSSNFVSAVGCVSSVPSLYSANWMGKEAAGAEDAAGAPIQLLHPHLFSPSTQPYQLLGLFQAVAPLGECEG